MNLCYGAFFLSHVAEELVESLLDNLTTRRIEIDMLEFSGIEFRNVDNRIMAPKLVQFVATQETAITEKGATAVTATDTAAWAEVTVTDIRRSQD